MSVDSIRWALIDVLSRVLPRRAGYLVAGLVSRVMWMTEPAGRAAVVSNIRRILAARGRHPSPRGLSRMGRETYRNFAKYLVDFFRQRTMTADELARIATIENAQYFSRAAAAGRGVIALTMHMGNWEMAAIVTSRLGYPLNAVFFPMKDPRTAALFERRRLQKGYRPISFGRAAAHVLRLLRQGEWVAMLADVDFSHSDDVMEFIGAPARLPAGPARIALKTGAMILPGFVIRRPDDTFLIRMHPPVDPLEIGTLEGVRERIREVLERELMENPTQWFVFVDFWDREATRRLAEVGVG
jgi:KDO2-lipid IV(A) lauroyltransferase